MLSVIALSMMLGTADPATYLAPLVVEMQKQWPANRTVNIVFHGHSVPAGYFATPVVNTFNAYPHLTHLALKERYPYAVLNTIVTAIGGENSISGEKRFKRDVLPIHPDLVCIDYGLNDRGAPLEQSRAAWVSMIKMAKAEGIKVLLFTPTPDLSAKLLDPIDPLTKQAEQIRGIAAAEEVGLVDSYARFCEIVGQGKKLEPYMAQINHPNRLGHDEVVSLILRWFPKGK